MAIENSPRLFHVSAISYRNSIPNAITFLGMLLGFQALIFAFRGEYVSAAWFLLFANLADLADGPAARLLNTSSSLGKQLDSFADLINCGLVPSFMVYQVFLKDWGWVGLALSFCLLGFGAVRLGRFSAMTSHKPDYFSGLPIPVVSCLLNGYIIFCDSVWGEYRYPVLVAVAIPVLCWMMVNNLRYPKSFFISPQRIFRTWQGWCALVIILLIVLFPAWIIIFPLSFIVGITLLNFLQPKTNA
jgi:CDP-diacylglycerol--serine O-phosphatidyltransferase